MLKWSFKEVTTDRNKERNELVSKNEKIEEERSYRSNKIRKWSFYVLSNSMVLFCMQVIINETICYNKLYDRILEKNLI